MAPARRALVIGNSDGIGLVLTRRLLDEGWQVAGLSRRPSPLDGAPGYRHVVADVASPGYRRAVAVIFRCLRRRPARLTYPKRTAVLAWLLGAATALRLWLAG